MGVMGWQNGIRMYFAIHLAVIGLFGLCSKESCCGVKPDRLRAGSTIVESEIVPRAYVFTIDACYGGFEN